MDKAYLHREHEAQIYQLWSAADVFNPDQHKHPHPTGKSFAIAMPPPNANDPLHIGHAMFVAIEDILTRYHRMLGDDTLWLPGTDHAGIETQFVFEKKLKKENKSRFAFDRETLYKMIWDYVQENSNIAIDQLKKLGASADWSRFTYMLEPRNVAVVLETFQELYKKGLIYRDFRLVNYCTHCGTAFSELEVNHVEKQDPLYYLKYGPFTIATVRPETKFRDTALAINPQDPRYKKWLGKTLDIPGLLGPIRVQVIPDDGVDVDFGTGIMKVTPAHDMHDFELGQKFHLPVTPIIDFQGRMDFSWFFETGNPLVTDPELQAKYQERAHRYHGKKVLEARKMIAEDLLAEDLLLKTDEKYTHTVGVCYRCGTTIEPLPLPQFFIKVAPLTKPALTALKKKAVQVIGAGHDKTLKHWLEILKDWNISRQIVWGIRMPVWYDTMQNQTIKVTFLNEQKERVSGTIAELSGQYSLPEIKKNLQELKAPISAEFVIALESPGENFLQETDTFDTWFSSAQWPFSTLKASLQKNDFERFYPTQVMETAYDILPFWVMRMLMVGLFKTQQVPFEKVYLHGLIRDAKGQKMSKSKGNVINPLVIVDQYGADALRMALVVRSSAGLDKSVNDGDFKAMRNFANKIWNAARFITLLKAEAATPKDQNFTDEASFETHLQEVIATMTQQLNDLKIGLAAETVYNEFWHWFCDKAIEQAKLGTISVPVLEKGLLEFLKLLHPFMPFVTEAVWQELTKSEKNAKSDLLVVTPWPATV